MLAKFIATDEHASDVDNSRIYSLKDADAKLWVAKSETYIGSYATWHHSITQLTDTTFKYSAWNDVNAANNREFVFEGRMTVIADDAKVIDFVKAVNGGFVVMNHTGKKRLSKVYSTEAEAKKRLKQIEYFKHASDSKKVFVISINDHIKP